MHMATVSNERGQGPSEVGFETLCLSVRAGASSGRGGSGSGLEIEAP